ncbi:helix-turn-helix domain-containing protein [Lacticaseibacillus saniviri]|uniref:helix-turn-helix domain-containing protein n=1 Tax=Lacticaseibacillus saniviri TaxID=931533 RepID=UPI001EDD004A|nr:helix-turn-helix transcriptional regulator [Lacticaseibacillus saniviri]MCG4280884.1 helix-turn-helix domain-containing protein [Lacticaseibacillus saniviri]
MTLGPMLEAVLLKVGMPQKALAAETRLSKSTINNYVHGTSVKPNEAVDIARSLEDSQFSMELGNMMLGLIKAFDGGAFYHDVRGIHAFDQLEEAEEKRVYEAGQIELIMNTPHPTQEQRAQLKRYLLEKLDSTVMDVTLLAAGAEQFGLTIMDLFEERMSEYERKGYMRKEQTR